VVPQYLQNCGGNLPKRKQPDEDFVPNMVTIEIAINSNHAFDFYFTGRTPQSGVSRYLNLLTG